MVKLSISQSKIRQLIAPNFRAKFSKLAKFKPKDKSLKRWQAKSDPAGLLFELTGTQKGPQLLVVVAAISDSNHGSKLNAVTQLLVVGSVLPEGQGLVSTLSGWITLRTSHPDHYDQTWGTELGGILFTQRLDSKTGLFTLTARSKPVHAELQPVADLIMDG